MSLLSSWELHLTSTIVDFHPQINGEIARIITPVFLIFIVSILVVICRYTAPDIYLLITCLIIVPALGLILPDLIQGGQKSVITRYFFISLLSLQVSWAYWLGQDKFFPSKIRLVILTLFIMLGVISCTISSQSNT